MNTTDCTIEANLPWVEGPEDRLFKRLLVVFIVLSLIAGITLNTLSLPPVQKKSLADVAPRLAKLILQKKKVPPPIKKQIKKPEPKKKDVKKEKPKPKAKKKKVETPKPTPKATAKKPAAKEVAQQSGLIALSDELADLRDSFDFDDIAELPQLKAETKVTQVIDHTKLLSTKASQGSGGIKTSTIDRKITTSELAQRKTSRVTSNIQSKNKIKQTVAAKSGKTIQAARSSDEIERVFQKNKGALFNLYNRALRKDPSLQGKVVLELTIAANGKVTQCVIISSELNNKRLEKRIISKVKKFKFASLKVPPISVTYPIDFLPS